jgi:hypothetical protein
MRAPELELTLVPYIALRTLSFGGAIRRDASFDLALHGEGSRPPPSMTYEVRGPFEAGVIGSIVGVDF